MDLTARIRLAHHNEAAYFTRDERLKGTEHGSRSSQCIERSTCVSPTQISPEGHVQDLPHLLSYANYHIRQTINPYLRPKPQRHLGSLRLGGPFFPPDLWLARAPHFMISSSRLDLPRRRLKPPHSSRHSHCQFLSLRHQRATMPVSLLQPTTRTTSSRPTKLTHHHRHHNGVVRTPPRTVLTSPPPTRYILSYPATSKALDT